MIIKIKQFSWYKQRFNEWFDNQSFKLNSNQSIDLSYQKSQTLINNISTFKNDPRFIVRDEWEVDFTPSSSLSERMIWTGEELILWSGDEDGEGDAPGHRYNPITDSWVEMSTVNAPDARNRYSLVWTGTEMIVWGGKPIVNNQLYGGKYNPSTDTWSSISTINSPHTRDKHTAIWTGTDMIVWGGNRGPQYDESNEGNIYNLENDTWTTISNINAPSARVDHSAIWTGEEMIIWGGRGRLNTGGKYNPSTNSWLPVNIINAPEGRTSHTAIWTGEEMIIWGGIGAINPFTNSGGKYNPVSDVWNDINMTNAPNGTSNHSAFFTGSEMVVWGGTSQGPGGAPNGGRYNVELDTWISTNTLNAPQRLGSEYYRAVWTGEDMIVWGNRRGGKYNLASDTWVSSRLNIPILNTDNLIWTGNSIIGINYASFRHESETFSLNPNTGVWKHLARPPEPVVLDYTNNWTGSIMIVITYDLDNHLYGFKYDPVLDNWEDISYVDFTNTYRQHTSVWTGTELLIWSKSNGLKYDPILNSWELVSSINAPIVEEEQYATWTGAKMLIWGGRSSGNEYVNSGGLYNPSSDIWEATSLLNAPTARKNHTAVWTNEVMIVWGGKDTSISGDAVNSGFIYNPIFNEWSNMINLNLPEPRYEHSAIWTGEDMIIWGGRIDQVNKINSGHKYNLNTDLWEDITNVDGLYLPAVYILIKIE